MFVVNILIYFTKWFQLNNLPSFFHEIPDNVFHNATNSRRKLVEEQNLRSIEQQSIRVTNHIAKENESTAKNSIHELICEVLESNLEFIPESGLSSETESKFKSFKQFLKGVGRESTKLSTSLGIRQFRMGLLLFISLNIKKFQPSLWDSKSFEVKSSTNPTDKCKRAIEKFVSLDILTLIKNQDVTD